MPRYRTINNDTAINVDGQRLIAGPDGVFDVPAGSRAEQAIIEGGAVRVDGVPLVGARQAAAGLAGIAGLVIDAGVEQPLPASGQAPGEAGSTVFDRRVDGIADAADAANFLRQATLGPTFAEIQAAQAIGSRRAWLEQQFGLQWPVRMMDRAFLPPNSITTLASFDQFGGEQEQRVNSAVMTTLLGSGTPLRSKLVWTLSKLFVISLPGGALDDYRFAYFWCSWFDRLNKHVFGNWRDLIESITYSIHMSRMLTYYNNVREGVGSGQPDENYAREILQLFSIGLWELNIDGTFKLDAGGNRIPTYTLDDVRQLARAFTGLTRWDFNGTTQRYDLDDAASRGAAVSAPANMHRDLYGDPDIRLRHYVPNYEAGSKVALGGRITIPAGTDPVSNLRMVHEALLHHPNTAPFFATRMIQHLVTSNPSPAYVGRVARVFQNNGRGVAGDLRAVWAAILTDPEAVTDGRVDTNFGRLRDGMDMWCGLARPLRARNAVVDATFQPDGGFTLGFDSTVLGFNGDYGPLAPRSAPSIFSHYDPTHQPTEFFGTELLGPEFQQWPAVTLIRGLNRHLNFAHAHEPRDTRASPHAPLLDYTDLPIAGTADELLDRLSLLLCGGRMSAATRSRIIAAITGMAVGTLAQQQDRVSVALQLLTQTPDFWVQA